MRNSLTICFWNIEVWAVQKHVNLVDLVKSFPTNIFLQNLASIQKRTSPIHFDHLAEKSDRSSISNLSTKLQTMPELLLASLYAWKSPVPASRPMRPHNGGPCFAIPPCSALWHWAHFALNSFAPLSTSPGGMSTSGSGRNMDTNAKMLVLRQLRRLTPSSQYARVWAV